MFFSFRRRFVELGVLRAVGLPFPTMMRLLGWELALLMGSGLAWGSLMGVWSVISLSLTYKRGVIRRFGSPYLVEIAWDSVWQILYLVWGALCGGTRGRVQPPRPHETVPSD